MGNMPLCFNQQIHLRKSPNVGRLFILLGTLMFAHCSSGTLRDGVFTNKDVSYRVGAYASTFRYKKQKETNITLEDVDGKGIVMAYSRCGKVIEEESAETLLSDLFLEREQEQELSRIQIMLDGSPALRTHHRVMVYHIPNEVDTVLLKSGPCVFWFQLIAKPAYFKQLDIEFERFFQGFQRLKLPPAKVAQMGRGQVLGRNQEPTVSKNQEATV